VIEKPAARDLPRITMGVLAILVLIVAAGWVLLPFVAAGVWATMIVIATWPTLIALQRRFGGRRGPAVAVMVFLLLAVLVAPIWVAVATVDDNVARLAQVTKSLAEHGLPQPPAWVENVPVIGSKAAEQWRSLAGDPGVVVERVQPYVKEAVRWIAGEVGKLGSAVVQLLLTVVIAGILYASGEHAATGVRRFLRRLAGPRGEDSAQLAAKAVRAVALGIVVTAIAQTVLAGIGLAFSGLPAAGALTAVVFLLCIAQLGPVLVMGPAAIWLFTNGSSGRGTVVLVFMVAAMTLDNFVRPILIKRGADLPLLLILGGVFGGLLAFGIVGLFVGPVTLAVAWTLVASWVAEQDARAGEAPGGPA
jgi:predicted PurR-regulated permease PerM